MNQIVKKNVSVITDDKKLDGILSIPLEAKGLVIFAHGSGSGRFSKRNNFVANELNKAQFATLLFDLLTSQEEVIDSQTASLRFNIEFLSQRLYKVTLWAMHEPELKELKIGYFGASTGAAAALSAAYKMQSSIAAIVSRGGRPDLVSPEILQSIKSPTLLIVGSNDSPVLDLNEKVFHELNCQKKLEIIPGASHLFEEPGKLELVTLVSIDWFKTYIK